MFIEERLQILFRHFAADDIALRIYKRVLRNEGDVIELAHLTLPELEVRNMSPCELIVLYALDPCIVVTVERDSDDVETELMVLLVNLHESRIESTAGTAPAGPEINHGYLVLGIELRECDALAVRCVECKVRSLVADAELQLILQILVSI